MHRIPHTSMPLALAAALAVALVWLPFMTRAALPHEATNIASQPLGIQYPVTCCSLRDCRPTLDGEVQESPEGYTLRTTGEFVAHSDKRVKQFPADGKIHVCQQAGDFDKGRILCLLVPPPAF